MRIVPLNLKKTILLVEDEENLLQSIKKKLEINDYEVLIARTFLEAMSYIDAGRNIDAIWLDHYLLEKENGMDFLYTIRNKRQGLNDIPVFVVSNNASSDMVKTYELLGVENFYSKSEIRLNDVLRDIEKVLQK